ncbi:MULTISPECIES: hypothetical protein [Thermococcus]|uniref:hypothetical protein n=1 Tax=Thermococcus TaxID=2263 RepID=UPI00064FEA42|nr:MULTISPECIES: hypothetical protein [Thermococcus]NJE03460.1 hypothetical protein [Thermococcus sp. MV11]
MGWNNPPSVDDVVSSIESLDSFCWRAELESGRFTWRSDRSHIDWNRREVVETEGSFEMLGLWKR